MTTSTKLYIGVAILVAVVIAFFLLQNSAQPQPSQPATNNPQTTSPAVNTPQQPASTANPSVKMSTVTVTYTDQGFSPSPITVPKGGAVKFVNQSSEPMWVASNPHPLHNGYPTTGGCINSTFDSCRGIQPGDSWSFTFTINAEWGYHNHPHPGKKGKVVVIGETGILSE